MNILEYQGNNREEAVVPRCRRYDFLPEVSHDCREQQGGQLEQKKNHVGDNGR